MLSYAIFGIFFWVKIGYYQLFVFREHTKKIFYLRLGYIRSGATIPKRFNAFAKVLLKE